MRDTIKLGRDIYTESIFEYFAEEPLDESVHVIWSNKGCLDVNLGKFRLAVSSKIFIAEASGDLEVFFNTTTHKKLFILLGCLWQCVKLTGVHAGWNEEVTGTFWCGLGKDRRLDFTKTIGVEEVTGRLGDAVT